MRAGRTIYGLPIPPDVDPFTFLFGRPLVAN